MGEAHHIRKMVLRLSFYKAFQLCVEAVSQIKRSKIIKEDRLNGIIYAKGGVTWKTFGDHIEFNLVKIDDNRTEVEFSSSPAIRSTLVDYGKNLQNV